jgi:sigma-B regulation protein RsbU (phosphoserine phosphatase)
MTQFSITQTATPSPDTSGEQDFSPVLALKELVAHLQREQRKTHELLSSLGFALRSFTNLNQFLELIPMIASRVADADGSALVIYRPNGHIWIEQLHCSDPTRCRALDQLLSNADQSLPQLQDSGPAQLSALMDEQVAQSLGPGAQLFGTSIITRNVERGRLYVFSFDPLYTWTDIRQKLVRLVADQTAVAIENDELAAELRQKERLDRELEIGAEIQLQLLPRDCPDIAGLELAARCRTASRVGGDYYDFIPTQARRKGSSRRSEAYQPWSIAIGDVMGKGVPAGLIMTMLRGMLRAEVLNRHSPGKILQHLNRVMYADLEHSKRFVTLFYSEYDPKQQLLSFSNAAHHPPFLWRRQTKTLQRLDTEGMLIGLDADVTYGEGQVKLKPGDVVMYFTDGFTDAANRWGKRFDEEGLEAVFQDACQRFTSPQEILEEVFLQVERFIGGGRSHEDDMTLVVLRLKDAVTLPQFERAD